MAARERILIRGGRVLTAEPGEETARVADVLVEGDAIREIAPAIHADDCRVIDAADAIVCPGFVDAHRHVWQTPLRGVAADWSLFDYFARMRAIHAAFFGPEDVYLGNHAGALEALAAGVTTLVDHCHVLRTPEHADEALRGLADAGIRGVFCYGLFPVPTQHPFTMSTDPDWRFDDARRIRRGPLASDGGLLRFGVAPGEVEAMPFEAIEREIRFARELGAHTISCHVAMGAWDRGRRLVAQLAEGGLLAPDLLFVHGASLDADELARLADSGAAVVSTPETELQMGMGRPVAWRARERGVRVALGVDIVSNYAGDLFAPMRLGLQAERGFRHEERIAARRSGENVPPPRVIGPRTHEAFELATREGARALGLEEVIGSLRPGKQADVVIVRTDALHLHPANDAVAALVLYSNPSDVDTVLVAGRVVKQGGTLVGVDAAALHARLRASSERLLAAFRSVDPRPIEDLAAKLML